jgi:hypothetical protein
MGERPALVVILSSERSGSTLLSVMLGAHAQILAPPELHLLRYESVADWRAGYPQAWTSLCWLASRLAPELEEADLAREYGSASTLSVYRSLLERREPGQIVVDKTPAYARERACLERAEGLEPFYVWLVRHPLGVARSRMELLHRQRREHNRTWRGRAKYPAYLLRRALWSLTGSELRRHVQYWVECNENIRAHLGRIDPSRSQILRYESLVRAPAETLTPLAERLGLEMTRAMLEPWRHAPQATTWGLGDGKVLETSRVDPERADAWRARYDEGKLPPEARRLLAEIGGG